MMHTRLAVYSKIKNTAKAIREAYAQGTTFDLEITGYMNGISGAYTSPQELKMFGEKEVQIRFKDNREVMVLKL